MTSAQRFIDAIWQRRGALGKIGGLALTPASWGFAAVVGGRNWLYDKRWLATTHQPQLKVISVGNLTVGGTGKTPMVLWLAQTLAARGYKVAILSRGYTGVQTDVTVVGTDGQPQAMPYEVGDEAVMLARLFPGVVIAGRNRAAAARLAQEQFGVEIAILEDGFQHRRLQRDVDLLLFSGRQAQRRPQLLPTGPFREPLSAARRADILLVTKSDDQGGPWFLSPKWRALVQQKPVYYGRLQPVALVRSLRQEWNELPLTDLSGKRIATLAGIADPAPFYQSLHEWDAEVAEVMEFPDHHQYSQADWQTISAIGQKVDLIVTTEKDLVKLDRFPFAKGKLVALRVRMVIEHEQHLLSDIEQRLMKAG
jgi:tetraacyldisaccharide 4'-kinase